MKKLKCSDLGGVCDMEISANSPAEMANKAMNHMRESHDDILNSMSGQDRTDWSENVNKKWNETKEA